MTDKIHDSAHEIMFVLIKRMRDKIGRKLEGDLFEMFKEPIPPENTMFAVGIFLIDGLASGVIDHATARAITMASAAVIEFRRGRYSLASDLAQVAIASFDSVAAGLALSDAMQAEDAGKAN